MNRLLTVIACIMMSISGLYAQQFKTHAVKSGETLESIAAYYKIAPADILKLNPEIENGVRPNTILIIPKTTPAVNNVPTNIISATPEPVGFKEHKVKRKETLFSISKKYDVSIDAIKKYNRELYSQELKKGTYIRIPEFQKNTSVVEENHPIIIDSTLIHIVLPKETKWGLANSYGITIAELQKMNPKMGDTLKIGDTLHLPKIEKQLSIVSSDEYVFYQVKPKQTMFSLTRKLNISEEVLDSLNPELKNGLKAGMILKLPKEKAAGFDIKNSLVIERFSLIDSINPQYRPNLAFILPFRLNKVELDSVDKLKETFRDNKLLNYSLDFYTGALMAFDSIKKLGISVNVKVYDSEASEVKVSRLLALGNFRNVDAIIGPFYPKPFNTVSKTVNIPVFAPVSSKNVAMNENVLLTIPNEEVLYERMVNYMESRIGDSNLIIIADKNNQPTKERLLNRFPSAVYLDPTDDQFIKIEDIQPLLSAENNNWVVVETQSISLLANITSVLNSALTEECNIMLFTTNKNSAFDSDNISNVYLSNLKFHFPTVDKKAPATDPFLKAYEEAYHVIPTRYAIRGFDLTMDILLRLAYEQDVHKWPEKISETVYVENKFNYNRYFSGGYYNTASYIAYYENLELKLIEQ
ncbi:LysM peptidoglycan-binding domain-containing protein [Leptobacterium sp. I13]|uniref:LysM peptidoglycan-binding domain-containing protein n=1 Tax=Leptobacterium meishanense TaxID=3128904 RepID=UPI0030EB3840